MGEIFGGSAKAFFTNIDRAGETFYVQFNPKEFVLDEKATWKDSGEHERYRPLLTYEKGAPTTVSMELIFDTSDTGDNCYERYVLKLRDFLATTFTGKDADGKDITRPPHVIFTWGSFNFDCVVESVGCTFLMFKPDGTPLRAKVKVGLKERERGDAGGSATDRVTLSAMGSMFSGAGNQVRTRIVQDGETLSQIAAETDSDMRDIARANGISNPMDLFPGDVLVIPGDADLASVLAAQQLGDVGGNYGDDGRFDPFGDGLDDLDDGFDDLDDAFEDIVNDLGVMVAAAGDEAAEARAELRDLARNAADEVEERAKDAADAARDAVDEVVDRAERAEDAVEEAADAVEEAVDGPEGPGPSSSLGLGGGGQQPPPRRRR